MINTCLQALNRGLLDVLVVCIALVVYAAAKYGGTQIILCKSHQSRGGNNIMEHARTVTPLVATAVPEGRLNENTSRLDFQF